METVCFAGAIQAEVIVYFNCNELCDLFG